MPEVKKQWPVLQSTNLVMVCYRTTAHTATDLILNVSNPMQRLFSTVTVVVVVVVAVVALLA